jgi:L-cystine uptake protein TcyP (sodium:dicarboxylate symporter family)
MDKAEEDATVMRELLAGLGLAPSWSYRNGKNNLVLLSKKKPLSGTVKMVGAIGLAIMVGIILNLLPDGIRVGVNDYFLTPVTNAIIGLLSAISGPLVFLSVLGSICSMGNMETLGKIGSKAIKVILLYMTVIGVCMTAFGSLFYHIEKGKPMFPDNVLFPNQSEDFELAKLKVTDVATGHQTKAIVSAVRGHLFCIEFSHTPRDLRGAKDLKIEIEYLANPI